MIRIPIPIPALLSLPIFLIVMTLLQLLPNAATAAGVPRCHSPDCLVQAMTIASTVEKADPGMTAQALDSQTVATADPVFIGHRTPAAPPALIIPSLPGHTGILRYLPVSWRCSKPDCRTAASPGAGSAHAAQERYRPLLFYPTSQT